MRSTFRKQSIMKSSRGKGASPGHVIDPFQPADCVVRRSHDLPVHVHVCVCVQQQLLIFHSIAVAAARRRGSKQFGTRKCRTRCLHHQQEKLQGFTEREKKQQQQPKRQTAPASSTDRTMAPHVCARWSVIFKRIGERSFVRRCGDDGGKTACCGQFCVVAWNKHRT